MFTFVGLTVAYYVQDATRGPRKEAIIMVSIVQYGYEDNKY
jgi:hypothetical protein